MPARRLALALPLILVSHLAYAQDGKGIGMIFDRLDADQSGEVTPAEITAAKERQFARADADGDGRVTEAELAAIRERMARLARLGGDGMTERALRLDRDGDGALSKAEFTATSPLLILIDADGNGAISRAELDRARAVFSPQP
jgi:EF hand